MSGISTASERIITEAGADLDLKARGGIVTCEAHGENFRGMALLRATQHAYVYDN